MELIVTKVADKLQQNRQKNFKPPPVQKQQIQSSSTKTGGSKSIKSEEEELFPNSRKNTPSTSKNITERRNGPKNVCLPPPRNPNLKFTFFSFLPKNNLPIDIYSKIVPINGNNYHNLSNINVPTSLKSFLRTGTRFYSNSIIKIYIRKY